MPILRNTALPYEDRTLHRRVYYRRSRRPKRLFGHNRRLATVNDGPAFASQLGKANGFKNSYNQWVRSHPHGGKLWSL
jgi:hypothetical protein